MRAMVSVMLVLTTLGFAETPEEFEARIAEQIEVVGRLKADYRPDQILQWSGLTIGLLSFGVGSYGVETRDMPLAIGGYVVAGLSLGAAGLNWSFTLGDRNRIEAESRKLEAMHWQHLAVQRAEGFSGRERAAIIEREIYIGMSEEALVASWGSPIDINRTITETTDRKQYVYPNSNYVYVENGKVTAVQQ